MSMKNSNDTIWNRTSDLRFCRSAAIKYMAVDSHRASKKLIPYRNPESLSLCLLEASVRPILKQVKSVDSSSFVMSKLIQGVS